MSATATALKVVRFIVANKELLDPVVKGVQDSFNDLPGESRAGVVRDFIKEAADMADVDDKTWEKAWRIVRPFFDLFVAKVKGKVQAKIAAAVASGT